MSKLLKAILIFISWFILSAVLVIILVIIFGLFNWQILHLMILGSVIIPTLIFRPKNVIVFLIIYLIILESILIINSPLHSFIPIPIQLRLHIIRPLADSKDCPLSSNINIASEFMKNDIDIFKIKIYYGGETYLFSSLNKKFSFPNVSATTWGNYIYLSEYNPCVPTSTIVHEFTHVWQYQHHIGFGIKWIPYWISYYWRFFTNFDSLYDYGGVKGLSQAKNENKRLRDFEIEQQARIVEDFYYFFSYPEPNYRSLIIKSATYKNYQYLVDQEFTFSKNNPL